MGNESDDTWIFGYGSLLWKVDFPFVQKVTGYVKGFERRFWQSSEDHRGVPGKVLPSCQSKDLCALIILKLPSLIYATKNGYPGRVVTLIEKGDGIVWGVAYKLPNERVPEIMSQLNYREKGGYKTMKTTFFPRCKDAAQIDLDIYIGTPDNPNFVGPETTQKISKIIVNAVGPSGSNTDYLFELVKYIKTFLPEENDAHLFELEQLVRQRIAAKDDLTNACA